MLNITFRQYRMALYLLCCQTLAVAGNATPASTDVTDMDIADLLKVQVTSVAKKAQALSDSPAAIFVISNEDIKRSGVTSVPEALRMAPGIDVVRINANKWGISSRGFNGGFANKLLVLLDGRSVYTSAFSGVYWDAQDLMLEDVERIEVIRGPGATLWGANAVNGVINIISKHAADTQGTLLSAGGGSLETGFGALRYGQKIGDETFVRTYAKGFQRERFGDNNADDSWNRQQGGFRLDSRPSAHDELTVIGNLYRATLRQNLNLPIASAPFISNRNDTLDSAGWNLTSRLRHTFSATSEYSLQLYYDHTQRQEIIADQHLDTLDVDFQHLFNVSERQNIIWGASYRANLDKFANTPLTRFTPEHRNTQLFTSFIQDEIALFTDTLLLTIGSKFEHNDYTGFEGQPNARLLWSPSPKHRVWGAVSRAVRTPSRIEHNANITVGALNLPLLGQTVPASLTLNGNNDFKAEVQYAYELGYRFTFSQQATLDITAFYNDYHRLRSRNYGNILVTGTPPNLDVQLPLYFNNTGTGNIYGFELSTVWQMLPWWRWDMTYSHLQTELHDTSNSPFAVSPQNKFSLRAVINPMEKINLDFFLRYVDTAKADIGLSTRTIQDYVTLDARLAWKIHPTVELALVGQNLIAAQHLEYIEETYVAPTQVPRSVYAKVTLEF